MNITVDAMGMECPLPVVEAKKALEGMKEAGTLVIKVDNEIAVANLTKFAASRGMKAESKTVSDKEFHVTFPVSSDVLSKNINTDASDDAPDFMPADSSGKSRMVVVLSSDTMGTGDDTLGKNLMKAFVFALTQQDVLPDAVLMYNGGVKLACEGSDSVNDLKKLEEEGVKVLCCGTCLDFYKLKESQGAGSVTNMYEIVEIQEKASKVIRP